MKPYYSRSKAKFSVDWMPIAPNIIFYHFHYNVFMCHRAGLVHSVRHSTLLVAEEEQLSEYCVDLE